MTVVVVLTMSTATRTIVILQMMDESVAVDDELVAECPLLPT